MLSSAPLSDAASGPCLLSLYHYPSRVFSFTSNAHVVVAPYVLHPTILYMCLVICSSYSIPSLPIVRSCVLLRVLKKYTIPPLVVSPFFSFFLFFFCGLGGIIAISSVRICKVAISIVQYRRVGLQNAWVKEDRGMLDFVI